MVKSKHDIDIEKYRRNRREKMPFDRYNVKGEGYIGRLPPVGPNKIYDIPVHTRGSFFVPPERKPPVGGEHDLTARKPEGTKIYPGSKLRPPFGSPLMKIKK